MSEAHVRNRNRRPKTPKINKRNPEIYEIRYFRMKSGNIVKKIQFFCYFSYKSSAHVHCGFKLREWKKNCIMFYYLSPFHLKYGQPIVGRVNDIFDKCQKLIPLSTLSMTLWEFAGINFYCYSDLFFGNKSSYALNYSSYTIIIIKYLCRRNFKTSNLYISSSYWLSYQSKIIIFFLSLDKYLHCRLWEIKICNNSFTF